MEVEAMIKEGVQAALEKLEECQALGCFLFLSIYYLQNRGCKEMLRDNVLGKGWC